LCDGSPSEDTFQLLKSLDSPILNALKNEDVTCLHATHFDVSYINHERLDLMEGQTYQFKANDEGKKIGY
jgi:hypothetical protein